MRVTKVVGNSSADIYRDADGNEWKGFRIPYKASTDPQYKDSPISFDLSQKAQAIGTTGFNWKNKTSEFVGFDFDSMVNHKGGLPQDEIDKLIRKVKTVPWVRVVRSKSGKGIHLFVSFKEPLPCANHAEHKLRAKQVLNYLSMECCYDFKSRVDCFGSVLWIWHVSAVAEVRARLATSKGMTLERLYEEEEGLPFQVVKEAEPLEHLPGNLREDRLEEPAVTRVVREQQHFNLTAEHQKLIHWLQNNGRRWSWVADKHLLVAHTFDLKEAHIALGLKGIYDTVSTGKESGTDHNCFCFPHHSGSWIVRRFGAENLSEKDCWNKDSRGNLYTYYNQDPDFTTVVRCCGGVLGAKKDYQFQRIGDLKKALGFLGIEFDYPPIWENRTCSLKNLRSKMVQVAVERFPTDTTVPEGFRQDNKKLYTKVVTLKQEPRVVDDQVNEIVRLVRPERASATDTGSLWIATESGDWHRQGSRSSVMDFLKAKGLDTNEAQVLMGQCIAKPWIEVREPFEVEYPGQRRWNLSGARHIRPAAVEGETPTWDSMLAHLGKNLQSAIDKSPWCQENNILCGADYLKYWIAAMFQFPYRPLPYLFFYSLTQATGKSTFFESVRLLFEPNRGAVKGNKAIQNERGFNVELDGAVFVFLDEIDLSESRRHSDRVKDWVTGTTLQIEEKGQSPYEILNTTKWVHCSNDPKAAPIVFGDTRICMIRVSQLPSRTPKDALLERFKKEAPKFLRSLLNMNIPPSKDRLVIPALQTTEKLNMEADTNDNVLDSFLTERLYPCDGHVVSMKDLTTAFLKSIKDNPFASSKWTERTVWNSIPARFSRGKYGPNCSVHFANMTMDPDATPMDFKLYCDPDTYSLKVEEKDVPSE